MEVNVGDTDRIVRIIIGLLFIVAALLFSKSLAVQAILVIVGIVFLFTAWTRKCNVYKVLNISTVEKK